MTKHALQQMEIMKRFRSGSKHHLRFKSGPDATGRNISERSSCLEKSLFKFPVIFQMRPRSLAHVYTPSVLDMCLIACLFSRVSVFNFLPTINARVSL